jgi:hypothetical protein
VFDGTQAFLGKVLQSVTGCDSYWLAVRRYWQLFSSQSFNMIWCQFKQISDSMVEIVLDIQLDEDLYITDQKPIDIFSDCGDITWRHLTIDPIKTRRFEWSNRPVRCASGVVRIEGRVQLSIIPDSLTIELFICTSQKCLPGEQISNIITR